MTSNDIRQTFFDFFREKQHTIVPSASLMPQSPGLLFTNAGMNQFVPYFLGTESAPYDPPRAADTQKCIRAGGKHNDLEDVGYDSYHHTLFEMLGNWSFGDYFKDEAIAWAWDLIVERFGFPPERLYATVYRPDPAKGDPGSFDQEAYDAWARLFQAKGLDPRIHIVDGNVKDNFWMMGDTGPCGPCSELHVDLTPNGDSKGQLVNADTDRCMEIWNLVFIQFNAEADGSFRDLPARHVDTGMGFERLCSIIQNTSNFTDFSGQPSNYATDVFQPLFRRLEELCGHSYADIYPQPGTDRADYPATLKQAIAFRVIADHLRTLAFSIADGILPGNTGRNYVLRRILRRAVRYGRELGFSGQKPFFGELVGTLIEQMGGVFPELRQRATAVRATLEREEASFNETLDRGLKRFEEEVAKLAGSAGVPPAASGVSPEASADARAEGAKYSKPHGLPHFERPWAKYLLTVSTRDRTVLDEAARQVVLDSLSHFHGERYILFAACVMPDHFHVLIEPQPKAFDPDGNPHFWDLAELMHSIKSFTAKEINKLTGGKGTVWERDYHDRMIRSESDLQEKFAYVTTNPVRAGLKEGSDYPFVWSRGWNEGSLEELRGQVRDSVAAQSESLAQDAQGSRRDAGAPRTRSTLPGEVAFELYDTFGFPVDLTRLLCAERGLQVNMQRFDELMEQQRDRARAARKSEVVRALDISTEAVTEFVGFDQDEIFTTVLEIHQQDDLCFVITGKTTLYAEMGGQVGDVGFMNIGDRIVEISAVQQIGGARAHAVDAEAATPLQPGEKLMLRVRKIRRRTIEAHHTATHLLHWALHEIVSPDAAQQGSLVEEDRLRFDFSSGALTREQIEQIEALVNDRIQADDPVSWTEVPHASVKNRADVMQFFGDKYGDTVRVVQIGGEPAALDGYSMELCGGTHVRKTGEVGLFKIGSEGAIAAGVRRIEAFCGEAAWNHMRKRIDHLIKDGDAAEEKLAAANKQLAGIGEAPIDVGESPRIMGAMLTEGGDVTQLNRTFASLHEKLDELKSAAAEAEKRFKKARAGAAAKQADSALAMLMEPGGPIFSIFEADASLLQELLNGLKKAQFPDAAFLVVDDGGKLHLGAYCGPAAIERGLKAGDILRNAAAEAGGKGGGKPDMARGAAPERDKLPALEAKARELLG